MAGTGLQTYLDDEAASAQVTLTSAVAKNQVIYAEGLLGIADANGNSGDSISVSRDLRAYQFTVPSTLTVAKGATVWVDITALTGHALNDAAYFTAAGSNRIRLFQALEAKDVNNNVVGRLLGGLGLS